MKTSFVYVLVSDGVDFYIEMTLLSIYSLRLYHPSDKITIVTDEPTKKKLETRFGKVLNGIVVSSVEVPALYDNKRRSRFLKTTLRRYIHGDFLFIDGDTIICCSLKELDSFGHDIGCVYDFHDSQLHLDSETIEVYHRIGFNDIGNTPYYNSGIMYVKDTPNNHLLYEEWHRCWLQSEKHGLVFDQPALCQANSTLGNPIQELPGIWNCQMQVIKGKHLLKEARIMHYYSLSSHIILGRDLLLKGIRDRGDITDVADRVARNPRSLGASVFSTDMEGYSIASDYYISDFLFLFCYVQPLYRFLLFLAKCLSRPTRFIIQLRNQH